MSESRYFRVIGKVQGVGFRASTCDEARRLGLAGWVRNRPDGDVELVAAGDTGALDALASWLMDGPASARVDNLQSRSADDEETRQLPSPFDII